MAPNMNKRKCDGENWEENKHASNKRARWQAHEPLTSRTLASFSQAPLGRGGGREKHIYI